jgi:hypothetical protein
MFYCSEEGLGSKGLLTSAQGFNPICANLIKASKGRM